MSTKYRLQIGYGKILSLFLLFVITVLTTACRHKRTTASTFFSSDKFDEDDFAGALGKVYTAKPISDSVWNKKKLHDDVDEVAQHVYQSNQYFPLWLDEDGNTKYVDNLLEELQNLQQDGLDPERYRVSAIKQQLQAFKSSKTPQMNSIVSLDTACTHAYLQASHDLLLGMILPKKADSLWFHANDSVWRPDTLLTGRLYQQGKYPSLDVFRSKLPTYQALIKEKQRIKALASDQQFMAAKRAVDSSNRPSDSLYLYIIKTEVPWLETSTSDTGSARDSGKASMSPLKAYQSYYGLNPTGKLDSNTRKLLARSPEAMNDQIDINLERLRWMPQTFEQQYVIVDVPLMELFLRRDGQDVMHMNVVVGKPERQTPSLNAMMANIVFNPSWGVPPTIMKKDVLPGVQKSGQAYLAKKDLVVYDHRGHKVDPSIVNASNYRNFVFRQPPGDDNALGYVKFNLPNKWDIYLHDTPHRDLFTKTNRAQSSGCVRVQQPREMAEYILSDIDGKNYDQEKIEKVIETAKTTQVNLNKKIPVHIVYLTAFDGGNQHVRFLKDIYKRDAKLLALLKGQPD